MTTIDRTESDCALCGLPIKDIGIDFWLHDADAAVDHEAVPVGWNDQPAPAGTFGVAGRETLVHDCAPGTECHCGVEVAS